MKYLIQTFHFVVCCLLCQEQSLYRLADDILNATTATQQTGSGSDHGSAAHLLSVVKFAHSSCEHFQAISRSELYVAHRSAPEHIISLLSPVAVPCALDNSGCQYYVRKMSLRNWVTLHYSADLNKFHCTFCNSARHCHHYFNLRNPDLEEHGIAGVSGSSGSIPFDIDGRLDDITDREGNLTTTSHSQIKCNPCDYSIKQLAIMANRDEWVYSLAGIHLTEGALRHVGDLMPCLNILIGDQTCSFL